jgi:hypothetical protein
MPKYVSEYSACLLAGWPEFDYKRWTVLVRSVYGNWQRAVLLGRSSDFLFATATRLVSEAYPASCQMGTWGSLLGAKQPE